MPLSARTLLQSWSRQSPPPSTRDAHTELGRVAAAPDTVRRARRGLPIVLAAMPPVFIVAFTLMIMLPAVDRFFGPDTTEMLAFLETLYQPNPMPDSRIADPAVRTALETYVAGKHGTRLRDAGFWDAPVMQGVSTVLSLARVLVAWAPAIAWLLYLATSPRVQGFVPTPPNPLLSMMLTCSALAIGAIFTIVRPSQSPHDWLLGTRVVPR